tara:strand:- start:568 stop:813 length:246 start_codon:yes stop_codon:yes gene_type:complete
MYSSGELLLISYINMLNRLNVEILCNENEESYNSNDRYVLRKIITESIREIEKMGGKVRIIENGLFALVQYNESECSISRL